MLTHDRDYLLNQPASLWEALRHRSIFITGGTGFFGLWLLETLLLANAAFDLHLQLTVLTRHRDAFQKKYPALSRNAALHFHEGDVRNFTFPEEKFSDVIHAATDVRAVIDPTLTLDTIIQGTQHTLAFATHCHAKRMLFVSSGAVYGQQKVTHVSEDDFVPIALQDTRSAYGIGKYTAEHICHLYAEKNNIDIKIARCFALVGPHLPLDAHFAVGNFIRDALKGDPIIVQGDGTPYRSYLYAADLVMGLLTILLRGEPLRAYNVGSDQAISIADLAHTIARCVSPAVEVQILQKKTEAAPRYYVPDITRAKKELGLSPLIGLQAALHLTMQWYSLHLPCNSAIVQPS